MVGLGRLMRPVVSFEEAVACVDAASSRLGTERVRLREAMGRVLAEEVRAATPIPPDHCAALDGFAVRADGSLGASAYNPVELPLLAVTAGAALPPGAGEFSAAAMGEGSGFCGRPDSPVRFALSKAAC